MVIVMVNKAVPPAVMLLAEKLFEIVGLEGETVSVSAAEQTPAPVQETDGLVLVTLAGGVMEATLLT